MNEQTQSSRAHGILLALIALVAMATLLVIMVRSQADDVGQSATTSNASPVVDTINIATASLAADVGSFDLAEATVASIFVHGTAHDDNGCAELEPVATSLADGSIDLFRSAVGFGAADDDNDHYSSTAARTTITGCAGGADLTVVWETEFDDVEFFADPTAAGSAFAAQTWTARIVITDDIAAASAAVTDDFEMNELAALDLDGAVAYGALALGATSAQDELVVTNTGNSPLTDSTILTSSADPDGDFVCTILGTIPRENTHYSTETGFAWAAGTALTDDATAIVDFVLPQRTGAASVESIFYRLLMPADGIGGVCSNTITITAVAS